MGRFKEKIVLITGGNSGIGRATAKLFKDEGAQVVITGRDEKTLHTVETELGVIALKSDASNLKDIDDLMNMMHTRFGRIDILFVNAGVAKFKTIEHVTEQEYDLLMNINLKGLFFTVQKALPLLKSGSAVVLNSSISAQLGNPGTSIYAATKAGVRSFGRTMSAELIEKGIRVNVVSPGPIDTPIFVRSDGLAADKHLLQKFAETTPMKRAGDPQEVAKAVAFLASSDASYIVGLDMIIDGGIVEIGP